MRYRAGIYARAFFESIQKAPERERSGIIRRFLGVIKKNGDLSHADHVLHEIRKLTVEEEGGNLITLEFAREVPQSVFSKFSKLFSSKDYVSTVLNPSLIAGVRITINGEKELDNSLKRRLKKLFNRSEWHTT